MTLKDAELYKQYLVEDVETEDEELNAFLFSLGCYRGEPITVTLRLKGSVVVSVKDSRYTFDNNLASVIKLLDI